MVFSLTGSEPLLMKAVQAAHEREVPVVLVAPADGGQISDITDHQDQEIRLPAHQPSELIELQLACSNLFVHIVETQLFG